MAQQPTSHLEILLRVADIAELAGVGGSAVVTNWRARSPKFPEPRVGGSQPLFELDEILEWLRLDGPRGRAVPEPTAEWLWPLAVEAFVQQVEIPEPRAALVALAAVRHLLGGGAEWDDVVAGTSPAVALRQAARAAERIADQRATLGGMALRDQLSSRFKVASTAAGQLQHAARILDGLDDQPFEQVVAPVLAVEGSAQRLRPQRTAPALARLLVAMGRVRERSTVYDPAVGEGDALVAAAEAARDLVAVTGRDISPEASFIALTRLAVRSCSASIVEPGDSLRDDRLGGATYSVVLLDPPVADRSSSSDLHSLNRWVVDALGRLKPNGRFVVVLPLHELAAVRAARRRPDQRLQSLLMQQFATHMLDGVVVVGRGLRSDIVGPLAVLSMTSPVTEGALPPPVDDPSRTVPVFVVAGRNRTELADAVDELAGALSRSMPADVHDVGGHHVERLDTPLSGLWATLDRTVDLVESSRSVSTGSSRRSSRPPDDRREMSLEDDAASSVWANLSHNSARLAALDSARLPDDWRDAAVAALRSDRVGAGAPDDSEAAEVAAMLGHALSIVRSIEQGDVAEAERGQRWTEARRLLEVALGRVEVAGRAAGADRAR